MRVSLINVNKLDVNTVVLSSATVFEFGIVDYSRPLSIQTNTVSHLVLLLVCSASVYTAPIAKQIHE